MVLLTQSLKAPSGFVPEITLHSKAIEHNRKFGLHFHNIDSIPNNEIFIRLLEIAIQWIKCQQIQRVHSINETNVIILESADEIY